MYAYISLTFSIELSGLDLPDITISNAASTAKRLSRKRPRRSLNVTAFERRLKDGGGKVEATIDKLQCFHGILHDPRDVCLLEIHTLTMRL